MTQSMPTIVFDTDCVLCSNLVAFVLKYERDHVLCFLGAWSVQGQAMAGAHGFCAADLQGTFLLIGNGTARARSDAALEVLRHLRAPWRWLTGLKIVPKVLRDGIYSFIARNRYRWFGRRDNCTLVPPQHAHRFSL